MWAGRGAVPSLLSELFAALLHPTTLLLPSHQMPAPGGPGSGGRIFTTCCSPSAPSDSAMCTSRCSTACGPVTTASPPLPPVSSSLTTTGPWAQPVATWPAPLAAGTVSVLQSRTSLRGRRRRSRALVRGAVRPPTPGHMPRTARTAAARQQAPPLTRHCRPRRCPAAAGCSAAPAPAPPPARAPPAPRALAPLGQRAGAVPGRGLFWLPASRPARARRTARCPCAARL